MAFNKAHTSDGRRRFLSEKMAQEREREKKGGDREREKEMELLEKRRAD